MEPSVRTLTTRRAAGVAATATMAALMAVAYVGLSHGQPQHSPRAASGPIVASDGSVVYHLADCPSARQIATHRRLYFASEADAKSAGLRPCKICMSKNLQK